MSKMEIAEIIKLASATGAKAALETFESEKRKSTKEWHDKRLFNTRLLLKNYRALNAHINSAVFEQKKIDEYMQESANDILELMWQKTDSDIVINSIKQSVERTKIIMAHVDMMLELYETFCMKSKKAEDKRRWRVTKAMYLDAEISSAEKIAKREHIDKRTVYRDIDAAVERISALIFGVSGLNTNNTDNNFNNKKMSQMCH